MNNKTLLLLALIGVGAYFVYSNSDDQPAIEGDAYPVGTIFVSGSNLPGRELVALEVISKGHDVQRISTEDLRSLVGDDQGQLIGKQVILTVKLGSGSYRSFTMPETTNDEMINQAVPAAIALAEGRKAIGA